jgi:hypothetical protein
MSRSDCACIATSLTIGCCHHNPVGLVPSPSLRCAALVVEKSREDCARTCFGATHASFPQRAAALAELVRLA